MDYLVLVVIPVLWTITDVVMCTAAAYSEV